MFPSAPGCHLTLIDNCFHFVSGLDCEAHCCLGTVLVPCHKDAYGPFLLFLESLVTSGQSGSRGKLKETKAELEEAMWLVPGFQGVG